MNLIPVAGVDVSKSFSDMCILSPDNTVFERVKIFHDFTSMQRSLSFLRKAGDAYGSKPVIVMESTSHYHRLLWKFLSDAGYEVIVINPIQSGGLKNIHVRKAKTDKIDAYKLAMLYRLKTLRPSNMPTQTIGALRSLGRQHQDLKHDIVRYQNRLTALLDQSFPGYAGVFYEVVSKGSPAVLEIYPTPSELLPAGEETLSSLLAKECKRGATFAAAKTEKLIEAAKAAITIGISQISDALLIRSCVAAIRVLFANVTAIDNAMREIVRTNPDIAFHVQLLQSIPGIGEYSAMVLLSEIGDFSSFQKPKQLTAYFGLDPSERQSGQFRGTKNKISKRGSRYVRCILNMAAHNSVYPTRGKAVGNPVLAEFFMKKLACKPHKVAMCAVMHKITNIIFAVLRDQKPFELRQPDEHNRLLKLHCKNPAA